MSAGNAKDLRKQVRNVVQELIGPLLQTEVFQGLADKVQKNVQAVLLTRLQQIDDELNATLKRMEDRSRDVQTFILNQVQAEAAKNNFITIPPASTESTTLTSEA